MEKWFSHQLIIATLIMLFLFSVASAKDTIDTRGYFPIEIPHGYTVSNGALVYRYQFLGPRIIENRSVYILAKIQLGANGQGERKELYSLASNGDIGYLGFILPDSGKACWETHTSLIIKGKMTPDKSYPIETLNDQGMIYLTLKGFRNVKLKNRTYRRCLVIEKSTCFFNKPAPGSLKIQETYYYARNIGMIKLTTAPYRLKNGKFSKDGPVMSEWLTQ